MHLIKRDRDEEEVSIRSQMVIKTLEVMEVSKEDIEFMRSYLECEKMATVFEREAAHHEREATRSNQRAQELRKNNIDHYKRYSDLD
ncbi:hypothetical protein JW796_03810 [Candidatus Dojkabacteria bacterium]|nr:hypothetical protein [Candidatus Dojkabacteria bacterium]